MKYLILGLSLVLCGCNESKSTAAASTPKSIFSEWKIEGVPHIFDFSEGAIGERFSTVYGSCEYEVTFTGTLFEGTMHTHSGIYVGTPPDHGLCDDIDGVDSNFIIENDILELCTNGSCENYIDPSAE